jgi:hypothetical protein
MSLTERDRRIIEQWADPYMPAKALGWGLLWAIALVGLALLFLASCTSGPQMPVSPLEAPEDEPSCHDEMPQEKEL